MRGPYKIKETNKIKLKTYLDTKPIKNKTNDKRVKR